MTKLIPALILLLAGCTPAASDIDELAREYLFLELSMGLHDKAHVDAYFGPGEIRTAAEDAALTPEQILAASRDLSLPPPTSHPLQPCRRPRAWRPPQAA